MSYIKNRRDGSWIIDRCGYSFGELVEHCARFHLALRDADLHAAYLPQARLEGLSAPGADLREAVLRDAVLVGAGLQQVDLTDADLTDADLRGADLTGARLDRARLCRARVDASTRLAGATFDRARMDSELRQLIARLQNLSPLTRVWLRLAGCVRAVARFPVAVGEGVAGRRSRGRSRSPRVQALRRARGARGVGAGRRRR